MKENLGPSDHFWMQTLAGDNTGRSTPVPPSAFPKRPYHTGRPAITPRKRRLCRRLALEATIKRFNCWCMGIDSDFRSTKPLESNGRSGAQCRPIEGGFAPDPAPLTMADIYHSERAPAVDVNGWPQAAPACFPWDLAKTTASDREIDASESKSMARATNGALGS